jgi:LytS/YehU family sensor histidine kinase
MTIALSEYLRTTLQQGSEKMISLREELGLVQRYLDIEKIRLGSRLRVLMDIAEDAPGILLPPLLIQPLMENALRHGIGSLLEGGTISIKAEVRHPFLILEIENPFDASDTSTRSSGMGQQNVLQRLAVAYQNEAEMSISKTDGQYAVRLRIPCEHEMQTR